MGVEWNDVAGSPGRFCTLLPRVGSPGAPDNGTALRRSGNPRPTRDGLPVRVVVVDDVVRPGQLEKGVSPAVPTGAITARRLEVPADIRPVGRFQPISF